MAFRWIRAYFERRESKESYHFKEPPAYEKHGKHVSFPDPYVRERKYSEDSYHARSQRPLGWGGRGRHDELGGTVEHRRPRWTTGWWGRGRDEPSGPPPRQDQPYERWPGGGESHGWVEDERPYREWPGSGGEDQRGGR